MKIFLWNISDETILEYILDVGGSIGFVSELHA